MFLGRAMITADGLCANAAFQVNGNCVIDRSELYYDGNSQGGIMGGSLVALSPDRSEEHTSELQSLMRISYAVFCLKKKKTSKSPHITIKNQINFNLTITLSQLTLLGN